MAGPIVTIFRTYSKYSNSQEFVKCAEFLSVRSLQYIFIRVVQKSNHLLC